MVKRQTKSVLIARSVLLFLLLIFWSIAGCYRIRVPAPSGGPNSLPPTVEDSTIKLPVSIDIRPMKDYINGQIPRIISEDPGHQCYEWGVYKGGDFELSSKGDTITGQLPIVYRLKVGLFPYSICFPTGSCGYGAEPARRANVVSNVKLSWNPDWHLDASPVTSVNLIDPCQITVMQYDITARVHELANSQIQFIDANVRDTVPKATNVKSEAQEGWEKARGPVRLGADTWLLLHTKAVLVSNPNGSGQMVNASVGLTARPEVRFSPQAPPPDSSPLPALTLTDPGDRFHIALDGSLTYTNATQLLATSLIGRIYQFPGNRKIRIRSVQVYGTGDIAVLQLGIDGDVRGTLYLQGTPVYQPVSEDGIPEVITIPNLDYTLETKNILAKLASWLLHKPFVESLRAAAKLPLQTKVSDLKAELQGGLNQALSPDVILSGNIESLNVRGVYLDSKEFLVRAVADGTAELHVSSLH